MKLVIDISDAQYYLIINKWSKPMYPGPEKLIYDWITNGVPLPKEHGRSIILSEDAIKREQTKLGFFSCQNWISEVGLSNATVAVIEADKTESEDKE